MSVSIASRSARYAVRVTRFGFGGRLLSHSLSAALAVAAGLLGFASRSLLAVVSSSPPPRARTIPKSAAMGRQPHFAMFFLVLMVPPGMSDTGGMMPGRVVLVPGTPDLRPRMDDPQRFCN